MARRWLNRKKTGKRKVSIVAFNSTRDNKKWGIGTKKEKKLKGFSKF